jgi:hypothetical protein
LAQGSAFAAKARQRAGISVEHTDRAVKIICSTSAELAAKICDSELAALSDEQRSAAAARSEHPGFERWRNGIRSTLLAGLPAARSDVADTAMDSPPTHLDFRGSE